MATPGVNTIIRDRFYSVSRTDTPTGPRVVAIARRSTANNTGGIADVDSYRATNEADVITAFGDGSDIHRSYKELVSAGADRIYLVPLPSDTVFNHTTGAVTSSDFGAGLFDAAFDAAESAVPDIIIPWGRGGHPDDWEDPATPSNDAEYGFHADNTSTVAQNWAYQVGLKVKSISENTNPCVAVMGIKPYISTAEKMTPSQINTHLAVSGLPSTSDSTLSAVGPYVIVVAGEIKPINYNSNGVDFGYTNAAASMAATLTSTSSYVSVVNKPLFNVDSVRYSPSRTVQNTLATKGVNAAIVNFNRIPVFADAVTFASATSDYTRITTKRIVDDATNIVRRVCQKFIGQPSNIQVRNSMETAISSGLRGMQLLGALLSSDFAVTYLPAQNKAIVDLVITPAFELKNIEVQVAVDI